MAYNEALELYEEYFATAERCNRIALPFEAWLLMSEITIGVTNNGALF